MDLGFGWKSSSEETNKQKEFSVNNLRSEKPFGNINLSLILPGLASHTLTNFFSDDD